MVNELGYDYDFKNDSLFIYRVEPYDYDVSQFLDNNSILDLNINGKPVAFEFLNASDIFKLDKEYFSDLTNINILVFITPQTISVKVKLTVVIHGDELMFDTNRIITNMDNLPILETELVNN